MVYLSTKFLTKDGLCVKDAHVARGGRGMDKGEEERASSRRDVHATLKV